MIRSDARTLLLRDPLAAVETQDTYRAVRDWALRGMGYGLGDHPDTSGERHVLGLLKLRTPDTVTPVVFDVGANVGEYAESAQREFCGTAALYCFEPSAAAIAKLYERTQHGSEVLPIVGIYNFGLSDVTREAPLHTEALGSGMASVYPRRLAHFGRSLGVEERASFRRLDDVCKEIRVARIDLLKLDVEGHELAVLRGAGDMLTSGAIGMIQWEMGGCNLDSRTSFQDFWYVLSPHYDISRIVSDGLAPVPRYDERDEVFVCSNFVAVWRTP